MTARLTFVLGMPGGGTSATAGILTKNGFYNRKNDDRFFEDQKAACLYKSSLWHEPTERPTDDELALRRSYFDEYRVEASAKGYDRCVVKIAWHLLWEPETLVTAEVEPLLVSRDHVANGKSIANRFGRGDAFELARRGQERIRDLHILYGWPVWKFGKTIDIQALEEIVGAPLPKEWFRPSTVKF